MSDNTDAEDEEDPPPSLWSRIFYGGRNTRMETFVVTAMMLCVIASMATAYILMYN